jgi:hypothetical protein
MATHSDVRRRSCGARRARGRRALAALRRAARSVRGCHRGPTRLRGPCAGGRPLRAKAASRSNPAAPARFGIGLIRNRPDSESNRIETGRDRPESAGAQLLSLLERPQPRPPPARPPRCTRVFTAAATAAFHKMARPPAGQFRCRPRPLLRPRAAGSPWPAAVPSRAAVRRHRVRVSSAAAGDSLPVGRRKAPLQLQESTRMHLKLNL